MTTQRLKEKTVSRVPLVTGFGLVAFASAFLWFAPPYTSGEWIDVESLVPLVGDTVTGPGSDGSANSGVAGLILFAVAALAGLPLLGSLRHRRWMLVLAAVVVSVFALVTLFRIGLFFIPGAAVLCRTAWRSRDEQRSSRRSDP